MPLGTKEPSKQRRPGEDCGVPALDDAIPVAFASPAGKAEHGDVFGRPQEGERDPAKLAQGGRRHMGVGGSGKVLKCLSETFFVG